MSDHSANLVCQIGRKPTKSLANSTTRQLPGVNLDNYELRNTFVTKPPNCNFTGAEDERLAIPDFIADPPRDRPCQIRTVERTDARSKGRIWTFVQIAPKYPNPNSVLNSRAGSATFPAKRLWSAQPRSYA
jgi:hypothetical protein